MKKQKRIKKQKNIPISWYIKSFWNNCLGLLCSFYVFLTNLLVEVTFCSGVNNTNDALHKAKRATSTTQILDYILSFIFTVVQGVGVVLVVYGICLIVESRKDDDSNALVRGVAVAINGAILIGLKIFLKKMGFNIS